MLLFLMCWGLFEDYGITFLRVTGVVLAPGLAAEVELPAASPLNGQKLL